MENYSADELFKELVKTAENKNPETVDYHIRNLHKFYLKQYKNYDEAYIEISINNDGSIEVVNMNAANDDVRRFIEKQISQIHLNNTIGEDQTYVFRVCFRAS
jgi:hypothetical protein